MLDVNNSPWFEAMASHENIELKIYNPIHFYAPWKMQARLHDKYLIIDDQMYLLGGRNTFNLFLGDYTPVKTSTGSCSSMRPSGTRRPPSIS